MPGVTIGDKTFGVGSIVPDPEHVNEILSRVYLVNIPRRFPKPVHKEAVHQSVLKVSVRVDRRRIQSGVPQSRPTRAGHTAP